MLTVALDLPSAQILADQAGIIQDLQFVMDCCKRLLTELAEPEEERDGVVPQALWSSALVAYARCFGKGRRFGLATDDVQNLPLHGAVMKFHRWVIQEHNKLTVHPADPFETAKIGAALAPSGRPERVEGIAIFSNSRVLIDAIGGRPAYQHFFSRFLEEAGFRASPRGYHVRYIAPHTHGQLITDD